MSHINAGKSGCEDFIETGYLADPASIDLGSASKCNVIEVLVDKVSYPITLAANWTVTQLVNAVNAITPGTLSSSGSTVASATGKTISNLEIICELPDFVEDFGNPALNSFLDITTGTVNPGASTTYTYLNDGGVLLPFGTYVICRASQSRFQATPAKLDALGNPNGGILAVNGDAVAGDFYKQTATGLVIGQEYEFSAYIANGSFHLGSNTVATSPNVTLRIETTGGVLIDSVNTGAITFGGWNKYLFRFVASANSVNYILTNNSPVTGGNDLVLDEIHFSRINRQHFTLLPRDRIIPVEIHKKICNDVITVEQVVSSDGLTIYTIPDPSGMVLSVGSPILSASSSSSSSSSGTSSSQILCDTVTSFLRSYSTLNGTTTVTDTQLDGITAYVPVGAVSRCATSSNDAEFEVLCDDVTSFLRKYTVDSLGVTTFIDTTLNGVTAYVPVGTVKVCTCSQTNPAIKSTIVEQVGAGIQTILAGARSITVQVITGSPTLRIGVNPIVTLKAGMTLSWGVDMGGPIGETLLEDFVFTGIVGSDFYLTTTRE